ncbi:hypothetical protein ABZ921_39550 [Streptomyces atriruber]|uniref:CdiI C-terminal domain-containing protein n=1 Tax=Streptomyces atriruber TaxID=545121 RepID=A0ABV3C0D4_9ACTN
MPSAEEAANGTTAVGRISVGDFSENFPMDLSYWSADDYRDSWVRALRRVDGQSEVDSCLVTSITDPATANFVFCWPVYRRGTDVYVQNSIIFLGELAEEFRPTEPWLSVEPHSTVDEDGNEISEWRTTIGEVRDFLSVYS